MERPLRRPAKRTPEQMVYEYLAERDTSRSHWREWRDLREEERARWIDAIREKFGDALNALTDND